VTISDGPRGLTPRVPILAYHSISDGPPPLCLSPARLLDHLASLHRDGWRALTLDDLLTGHARGGWPERSVMLTFDDGLVSFATEAVPLLARFGFVATVFVVAGRMGGTTGWPEWPRHTPVERLLDTGALRDAAASGMEIGAHSRMHASLSRLPPAAAAREILDSRTMIEDAIGRPVRSFAYPFGHAPLAAARVVGEHFDAGFGIRLSHASTASRVEVFERIDAYYLRRRSSLSGLSTMSSRAYLSARSFLRELRRAAGSRGRSLEPDPRQRDA
jgi:peptidoglycan/xylan/chitin deacetylase (PgdA/CDA1 family)